jgi:large subunit ribosomal protein L6|tara:strand:- start:614 stop:1147 length:534 start_codon:yes stop_codon:yes gene_type:complete
MSRIGQSPISLSDEVEVSLDEKNLKVKGPKGELFLEISKKINVDIENKVIKVVNNDNSKQGKAVWGTTRSLINNMVVGVTKGFSKNMEIVGVGYRGSLNGKVLTLNLGLSHTVEMNIPEGIEIKMDGNTKFSISGVDKQKIGQFASVVRSKRPPEPFKGKGVRYADEYVVRKEGKKK